MFRNALILTSILLLLGSAACTSQVASAALSTSGNTALYQISDPSLLTVKDKLGIGILSLDQAGFPVSTEQAAALLPLWQAVSSLGTDKNSASAELAALYVQIQEVLTSDQVAQIEQLTWSQAELSRLVQQYRSQTTQVTSADKSTSSSSSSIGQGMGGGPGGDMQPPDGGMMMGGGAGFGTTPGESTTGETQQTLIQNQISSQSSADLNVLLANAVTDLLEQQLNA